MIGKHILLDMYDCDIPDYEEAIYGTENILEKAKDVTVVGYKEKLFSKKAYTYMFLLAESHVSVHTWEETNYVAADIFTCGSCDADLIATEIKKLFNPREIEEKRIYRGAPSGN